MNFKVNRSKIALRFLIPVKDIARSSSPVTCCDAISENKTLYLKTNKQTAYTVNMELRKKII